jgi:hypothetical protein
VSSPKLVACQYAANRASPRSVQAGAAAIEVISTNRSTSRMASLKTAGGTCASGASVQIAPSRRANRTWSVEQ